MQILCKKNSFIGGVFGRGYKTLEQTVQKINVQCCDEARYGDNRNHMHACIL